MSALIVNSADSLQNAIGELRERWNAAKYLRLTIKTGKARSLDQNGISHVWYEQIVRELREDTALGVKCACKLNYGVPILRAEDADFREFYDATIKHALGYEDKVKAMRWIPVTSLMTTDQLSQYLVAMQEGFRPRGVFLEFPKEAAA